VDGGPWLDLRRPPLREDALRAALLPPSGPFARLDVVPRTGSTNADVVAAAAAEPAMWPDLSVLTTDHQDAGRGRLQRMWDAPARAALTVSVLLRPAVGTSAWSWLPLLAGTAVAETVRRIAGVDAGLKWPNDVLVRDPDGQARKVCGVLGEVVLDGGSARAVVVGIGLNVSQGRDELPVATATSLRLAGAATTDRDTLLRAVLRSLATTYAAWTEAGADVAASGLAARVREACWTLGERVRVELPGGRMLTGTAEELDDDGRLIVRTPTFVTHAVAAGDVVHLRVS
jgi:BirA family transcriptional regulator, biotin operon repressor / biotin---[acetyl-CoA-carboxylase] ligase